MLLFLAQYTRLNCPECNKTKVEGLGETNTGKYKTVKLKCENCDHVWDKKIYPTKLVIPKISRKGISYPIYESNLCYSLDVFILRILRGCGWISIDSNKCKIPLDIKTFKEYDTIMNISDNTKIELTMKKNLCYYEMTIHWNNINTVEKEVNAPFNCYLI